MRTFKIDKRPPGGIYVVSSKGVYEVTVPCTITFSKRRPLRFNNNEVRINVKCNNVGIVATAEQFSKLEIEYGLFRPPECDTSVKPWVF